MSTKPYKVDYTDGEYLVNERPTGLTVERFGESRSAKMFANFLNGGNGFNGHTPEFFTQRLEMA